MDDTIIETLLLPENIATTRVFLKSSFKDYIKVIHYVLFRSEFILKDFHKEIIKSIEDIVFGRAIKKNLCINIAPQVGKSLIVKYAVSWFYAQNKMCRNIYTSANKDLILGFSSEIKSIIESYFYSQVFCLKLKPDTKSKSCWAIEGGGYLRAAPIGGKITGQGAGGMTDKFNGALIIDDPLDIGDLKSKVKRQNVIDFYAGKLKSRLTNKNKTPTILVMQRLHKEDLTGYIKENEAELWKFIEVKSITENNKSIFEEYLPLNFLLKEKSINPYNFWAFYMQQPIVLGGSLIKSEWFKRYDIVDKDKISNIYIVCDTAFSIKQTADFSCFMCVGLIGHNVYILDVYCNRVDFPTLKKDIKLFFNKQIESFKRPHCIYIEKKASGQCLLQELRDTGLPIRDLMPSINDNNREIRADKLLRYNEISTYIYDGYVYIPNRAIWLDEFISQSECFDGMGDTHDDIIDCLIYAIKISKQTNCINYSNNLLNLKNYIANRNVYKRIV